MRTGPHRRRSAARRRPIIGAVAAVFVLLLVSAGCASDNGTRAGQRAAGTTAVDPDVSGSITVSAAASLTAAFGTIRDDFLAAHPDAQVTLNFGSSGALESQIETGAPADVAAFADEATMAKLAEQSLLDRPSEIFATNRLVMVAKPGNPKGIRSLADLARTGTVSLCAESAPCGRYAREILTAAGASIPESSITRGQDVRTTLGAVTEGDADAAIVYLTDARAAGSRVSTIEIPASQNLEARYPIAATGASRNPVLAQAFLAFVLGSEGQSVLRDAGFGAP